MKKKRLLIVSDFIEGLPVIASVRYGEIVERLKEEFEITVVSNKKYNEKESVFADKNFKFTTLESNYSSEISNKGASKDSKIEFLLRNPLFLKIWRTFKLSKLVFFLINKKELKDIKNELNINNVDCIFVTVPDIQGLYIMDHVHHTYPEIPVVVEVRDIINHSIGTGNPTYIYKRAEKKILKSADMIITLSRGIESHFHSLTTISRKKKIKVIRNGYELENFRDCNYNGNLNAKEHLVFSHIGSIYKGRNILDFLLALEQFSKESKKEITFNVVGVLDKGAEKEISGFSSEIMKINIMGSQPHKKALSILKKSDVAVILTHPKGSEYAIPGKTFEYIGAAKPIIAVTTDPEVVNIINTGFGECASHNTESILEKLNIIINKEYDFSSKEQFSRKAQTLEIIDTIYEVIN